MKDLLLFIGTYDLGLEQVDLWVRSGFGADFAMAPEKGRCPKIQVGLETGTWQEAVGRLHHEAMELTMAKMGLRYSESPDYARDNGASLFVMTHTQFSEASARTGMFLAQCLPDFGRGFRKWRKKK